MDNYFTAKVRRSRGVNLLTAVSLILIFMVGFGVPLYGILTIRDSAGIYVCIGIIAFLLFCLIPFLIKIPLTISLTEHHLVLHRVMGSISLSYMDIESVQLYTEKGIGDFRIFGNGGLFAFTGKFYNRHIGFYTAYVGDYSQAFLVGLKDGRKFVFSCEHPQAVVDAVRQQIHESNF